MTPFYIAVTVILVVAGVLLIGLHYYKELYELPHKDVILCALCVLVAVVFIAYQLTPAWRKSDAYTTTNNASASLPKSLGNVACAGA